MSSPATVNERQVNFNYVKSYVNVSALQVLQRINDNALSYFGLVNGLSLAR